MPDYKPGRTVPPFNVDAETMALLRRLEVEARRATPRGVPCMTRTALMGEIVRRGALSYLDELKTVAANDRTRDARRVAVSGR